MGNWDDFRVFLTLARERTLAASARRLRVDQSTIGRRLAALEAHLGTRLFDRTPHGYLLTGAGEAVLPQATDIERAALEAERRSLGEDSKLAGQVLLATSDSFALWFLVPRLAAFTSRHPAITLELVLGNAPVDLSGREADLSLRFRKPTEPDLVARKLATIPWAVYANAAYLTSRKAPRPGQALAGHEVIGFAASLGNTVGSRWLSAHAGDARVALSCNSLLGVAAAVEAGLGLGALPCLCGDPSPALRRVWPGFIGAHDLWLVVHADVRRNARVRAAMDFVLECVRAERTLLEGAHAKPTRRRAARGAGD